MQKKEKIKKKKTQPLYMVEIMIKRVDVHYLQPSAEENIVAS